MPLTFAICLFFATGFTELVRQGWFDAAPLAALGFTSASLGLAALLLLNRDVYGLIRPGAQRGYGPEIRRWTCGRTLLLLTTVPLMWLTVYLIGGMVTGYVIVTPRLENVVTALAVQWLLVALAQELFFREAVLKVFGAHPPVAYAVTALAVLVFYLPHGSAVAMMAAGSGVAHMVLRQCGMNIFAVAFVHAASTVLFGRVVVAHLSGDALWLFALAYVGGHLTFALGLLLTLRPNVTPVLTRQAG